MQLRVLYKKALALEDLDIQEALYLYREAPISDLMYIADELRKVHTNNSGIVGWIVDRNVNITNVCIARCKFCNFSRPLGAPDSYITTMEEYRSKIKELFQLGGNQLLLQGGLHPYLDIEYYEDLFRSLKREFPQLKLHALSPAEIVYISKKSGLTYRETLQRLINAGLDSLPGAGAEILSDRVRRIVSPGKCTAEEWLEVMRQAHILNLPTSATMMYGTLETDYERIEHLIKIRDLQKLKPSGHYGFITFVPWPYQPENTRLQREYPHLGRSTAVEYIRIIAISRIVLNNIKNIQASWLTVGKEVAQICLHAGANDFGSIMIEENVVSSAGAKFKMGIQQIQEAIKEAGFIPAYRNQKYEYIDYQPLTI